MRWLIPVVLLVLVPLISGCGEDRDDESRQWRLLAEDAAPFPNSGWAAAFDEHRGRLVVCGGTLIGATWEYDGQKWSASYPDPAPPVRERGAACYDADLQAVVFFGGVDQDDEVVNTLWMWDGITWTDLTPQESPPKRAKAGLAYDSDRHCLVLFGGSRRYWADFKDTWEWRDGIWTKITTTLQPEENMEFGMAYDPVNRRTVIFGGWLTTGSSGTWVYDGFDWSTIDSVELPPERRFPAMGFNRATGRIALFGGAASAENDVIGDYWELEGNQWRQLANFAGVHQIAHPFLWQSQGESSLGLFCSLYSTYALVYRLTDTSLETVPPVPGPQPLGIPVGAYDDSRHGLICLSPHDCGGGPETWLFAEGAWRNMGITFPPKVSDYWPWYDGCSLVNEVGRGIIMLLPRQDRYAGVSAPFAWFELSGDAWVKRESAAGPKLTGSFASAYDRDRGILVLFGGLYSWSSEDSRNDTWEFDGTTWRQVFPPVSPPPRNTAAMAYDEDRHRIVLFGGQDHHESEYYPAYRDTWEYDGTTWRQVATTHAPDYTGTMTYHRGWSRIVMASPGSASARGTLETWEYDGTDWTLMGIPPPYSPNKRTGMSLTYDSDHDTILLFGGEWSDYQPLLFADVWELFR